MKISIHNRNAEDIVGIAWLELAAVDANAQCHPFSSSLFEIG